MMSKHSSYVVFFSTAVPVIEVHTACLKPAATISAWIRFYFDHPFLIQLCFCCVFSPVWVLDRPIGFVLPGNRQVTIFVGGYPSSYTGSVFIGYALFAFLASVSRLKQIYRLNKSTLFALSYWTH